MSLPFTTHGDLVPPTILRFFGNEGRDLSGNITWRDRVGTSKANPFKSEAFA